MFDKATFVVYVLFMRKKEKKRMFTWVSEQTHTDVKIKAILTKISIEEYLRRLVLLDLKNSNSIHRDFIDRSVSLSGEKEKDNEY